MFLCIESITMTTFFACFFTVVGFGLGYFSRSAKYSQTDVCCGESKA